jgi:hypothetical protein
MPRFLRISNLGRDHIDAQSEVKVLYIARVCAIGFALVPALAAAQRIAVGPTPTSVIASTTDAGDLRFASAAWATRLASGDIAIADLTDATVRIVGVDGALKRSLGRRGAGPGEYRLPVWVGRCANDSLAVWDATARLTTYSPAALANESPATRQIADAASSLSASCSANGEVALVKGMQPRRDIPPVLSGENPNGGQYNVVQMSAALIGVNAQGTVRTAREQMSQGQWVLGRLSPQGGMGGVPRPLAPTTTFAYSGNTLVIADAASGEVNGVDAAGGEVFKFAATGTPRPAARDDYERAATTAVALVPAQARDAAAAFLRSVQIPEQLPHFTRVLVDPSGLLWLVVSPDGAAETRFRVYRANGQLVSEPRISSELIVFEVGANYLLGKRSNADDEDEIVMYRVTR